MSKNAIAYVDGCFNKDTKVYGSGVVLRIDGQDKQELSIDGNDPEIAKSWQIGGELIAAIAAINICIANKVENLDLYYDYTGIYEWVKPVKPWKAKNNLTRDYQSTVNKAKKTINIRFHKVAAHTGVEDNERADRLSKDAAGIA